MSEQQEEDPIVQMRASQLMAVIVAIDTLVLNSEGDVQAAFQQVRDTLQGAAQSDPPAQR